MPTYEYRCPEGHDSEDFVLKISDAKAEIACPTCGAPAPRRVSGGSGLLFKGSGFYITDYGKDGKKDQKTAPKSTDSGASSGGSSAGGSSGASSGSGAGGAASGSSSGSSSTSSSASK